MSEECPEKRTNLTGPSILAPLDQPSENALGPLSTPDIVKSGEKNLGTAEFSISDAVSIDGREATVIMDLRPEHQFIKVRWLDDCSDSPVIALGAVEVLKLEADRGDVVVVNGKEGTIIMDMRPEHNFVKVRWSSASSDSDGELVVANTVKLVRRRGCSEAFGKGDKVTVGGRAGIVTMDLRPEQEFIKVRWLDDGSESEVLPVYSVTLVSKGSPGAAAEISGKPSASAEVSSSSQGVSSGVADATPALSSTPVWLDPQEEVKEPSGGAYSGTVTIYESDKGHGFINSARVEGDVFFYVADCIDAETMEGDEVTFHIEENDIGQKIAKRIVGGSGAKKGAGKDSGTPDGNKGKDKGGKGKGMTKGKGCKGGKAEDMTNGKGWKGGKTEFYPGTSFNQQFFRGKEGKGKVILPPSRMFPAGAARDGGDFWGPTATSSGDFWGPTGRNGYVLQTIHRDLQPCVESMHDQELFQLGQLGINEQINLVRSWRAGQYKGVQKGRKGAPY